MHVRCPLLFTLLASAAVQHFANAAVTQLCYFDGATNTLSRTATCGKAALAVVPGGKDASVNVAGNSLVQRGSVHLLQHDGKGVDAARFTGGYYFLQNTGADGEVGAVMGGGAFSVCVSANYQEFTRNTRIFDFGKGSDSYNIFLGTAESTSTLVWGVAAGANGAQQTLEVENFFALNEWHHVCVTMDLKGGAAIYKNGEEARCTGGNMCSTRAGKSNPFQPLAKVERESLLFGKSNSKAAGYQAMSAWLKELHIFDGHLLTDVQVRQEWQRASNVDIVQRCFLSGDDEVDAASSSCPGAMKLAGVLGLIITELDPVQALVKKGNAASVTIKGGLGPLETHGGVFNGKGYFSMEDGIPAFGGKPFTVCANVWYNTAFPNTARIFDFGGANGDFDNNVLLYTEGRTSTLGFTILQGSGKLRTFFVADFFTLQKWTHVCVSADTAGTMHAFKNGDEMKCTDGSACDDAGVGTNGWLPLKVDRAKSFIGGSALYSPFVGSISDFVVYDGVALPATSVETLHALATIGLTTATSTATTSPTTTATVTAASTASTTYAMTAETTGSTTQTLTRTTTVTLTAQSTPSTSLTLTAVSTATSTFTSTPTTTAAMTTTTSTTRTATKIAKATTKTTKIVATPTTTTIKSTTISPSVTTAKAVTTAASSESTTVATTMASHLTTQTIETATNLKSPGTLAVQPTTTLAVVTSTSAKKGDGANKVGSTIAATTGDQWTSPQPDIVPKRNSDTEATCRGQLDPEECALDLFVCGNMLLSTNVSHECPIMCSTCEVSDYDAKGGSSTNAAGSSEDEEDASTELKYSGKTAAIVGAVLGGSALLLLVVALCKTRSASAAGKDVVVSSELGRNTVITVRNPVSPHDPSSLYDTMASNQFVDDDDDDDDDDNNDEVDGDGDGGRDEDGQPRYGARITDQGYELLNKTQVHRLSGGIFASGEMSLSEPNYERIGSEPNSPTHYDMIHSTPGTPTTPTHFFNEESTTLHAIAGSSTYEDTNTVMKPKEYFDVDYNLQDDGDDAESGTGTGSAYGPQQGWTQADVVTYDTNYSPEPTVVEVVGVLASQMHTNEQSAHFDLSESQNHLIHRGGPTPGEDEIDI